MIAARSLLGILAIALCAQCLAFSPLHRSAVQISPSASVARSSPLFMSEPAEDPDTNVPPPEEEQTKLSEEKEKSKNVLSFVPLFFKFCVVLAVKFITDVLVFPPLFLWRFIRLIYRKFLNLIGKGSKDKPAASS